MKFILLFFLALPFLGQSQSKKIQLEKLMLICDSLERESLKIREVNNFLKETLTKNQTQVNNAWIYTNELSNNLINKVIQYQNTVLEFNDNIDRLNDKKQIEPMKEEIESQPVVQKLLKFEYKFKENRISRYPNLNEVKSKKSKIILLTKHIDSLKNYLNSCEKYRIEMREHLYKQNILFGQLEKTAIELTDLDVKYTKKIDEITLNFRKIVFESGIYKKLGFDQDEIIEVVPDDDADNTLYAVEKHLEYPFSYSEKTMGIYFFYEEPAQFTGGKDSLKTFLINQLKYPKIALEEGIEGKVHISMIVNAKGEIVEPFVSRKLDKCPECNVEALRLVKMMPNWKPATINGKPVNSTFILPIMFKLN
jgi:protein TonB